MTWRKILIVFTIPFLVATVTSCDLFEDLTKTESEKNLSNLANEWIVDSVRVREYGYIVSSGSLPQTPLVRDTLLPIIKIKFNRIDDAFEGTFTQTSIVNGNEVVDEYRWRYYDYLELLYPNPNIGFSDVVVIYDVEEISNKKLRFNREENLVEEISGVRYGSLIRNWKMHR